MKWQITFKLLFLRGCSKCYTILLWLTLYAVNAWYRCNNSYLSFKEALYFEIKLFDEGVSLNLSDHLTNAELGH